MNLLVQRLWDESLGAVSPFYIMRVFGYLGLAACLAAVPVRAEDTNLARQIEILQEQTRQMREDFQRLLLDEVRLDRPDLRRRFADRVPVARPFRGDAILGLARFLQRADIICRSGPDP